MLTALFTFLPSQALFCSYISVHTECRFNRTSFIWERKLLWSCSVSINKFDRCKEVLTVSWLWLNEINPKIKWMLEVAEEHSKNCDHPNSPRTALVPAVGWTALLPEPCHQLSLGLMPQVPLSPLQMWRRAGVAWRLMVLLPAVFLQGSRRAGQVAGSPTLPHGP